MRFLPCVSSHLLKSFKIEILIILDATSITTYATIAEVKAETTLQMVEDRLKGEEYLAEVEDEAGWITFCPACILKCLTGDR